MRKVKRKKYRAALTTPSTSITGQLVLSTPRTRLETTMLMMPPAVEAGTERTLSRTGRCRKEPSERQKSTGAAKTKRKSMGSVTQESTAVMISGMITALVLSLFPCKR